MVEPEERARGIGVARTELAPRSHGRCHRLVKCPVAWSPGADPNDELMHVLIVRVSCAGDPAIGWLPDDRDVAWHAYQYA